MPGALTLSWSEQVDGSFILVIFSITGEDIPAGSGPIATLTYESTSIYESNVTLSFVETVLSNDAGQEIDHLTENGTIYISGEEPPPEAPEAPEGLVAIGGDSEVLLSWDPSFSADEYLIYREEAGSGESLYSISCDGGSWQSEITWELENSDGIVLTGGSPYSQTANLEEGDYTLLMHDSYGDGWNGNSWSAYDENNSLVASCTVNEGSEGVCNFSLGGFRGEVSPVLAIDNANSN